METSHQNNAPKYVVERSHIYTKEQLEKINHRAFNEFNLQVNKTISYYRAKRLLDDEYVKRIKGANHNANVLRYLNKRYREDEDFREKIKSNHKRYYQKAQSKKIPQVTQQSEE